MNNLLKPFLTFSTAFVSEGEINQSELDVHSNGQTKSLIRQIKMAPVVLFSGFKKTKQQKATSLRWTREKDINIFAVWLNF